MGNIIESAKHHWIEIESFSFCYPNEDKPALHQINLSADKGDFLVFFGKSGCGKSTLFSQFKTVLTPHGKTRLQLRPPESHPNETHHIDQN